MKCRFPYSYEEFCDHLAAMKQVTQWEYLHFTDPPTEVGTSQTESARTGRILEYFSDTYKNPLEAIDKSRLFTSVFEYIAGHKRYFAWRGLLKIQKGRTVGMNSALLRAVHFALMAAGMDSKIKRRKIANLAKAFLAIESKEL